MKTSTQVHAQEEDTSPDFSKETPQTHTDYGGIGALPEQQKLETLVRQFSSYFRKYPYAETLGPLRTPRLLYKIWVKDAHEELVRGGSFGDLDARAMRNDLVAAGNDFNVENHALNVPHSIVNPAFLFDELEVKRVTANKEKLPDYPAPPFVAGK